MTLVPFSVAAQSTDPARFSWAAQPAVVQIFLVCHFGILAIVAVRFAKWLPQLYRLPRTPILLENILAGKVDPDLLAAGALAHRLPVKVNLESGCDPGAAHVLKTLGSAENSFQYLWEACSADVLSARRASVFTFLLSMIMVAYSASPIYFDCWTESKLTGYTCLVLSVWRLLTLLAVGWSCCAGLYMVSSFLERSLTQRKIAWTYFSFQVRNALLL